MDYLQMYPETFAAVKRYAPADRCYLYEAMASYAFDGSEPDWPEDDLKWLIWEALKQRIDVAAMYVEKQRQNGEKGGRPKTQDNPEKPKKTQRNPKKPKETQQKPTEPNKSPESESESESDTESESERDNDARAREEVTKRFDRFWAAYPKKIAKKDAEKAFRKLDPDDGLLAAMMASLDRWKMSEQWTRDGTAYVPNPATWLNGERWKDEVPPPSRPREKTVIAQQYEQRDYSQDTSLQERINADMTRRMEAYFQQHPEERRA